MSVPVRTIFFFALAALIASCKKDEKDEPVPPALSALDDPNASFGISDFSLLTVGNYWVYERRTYDSTGVPVMSLAVDSFVLAGDTLINGNVYLVQRHGPAGSPSTGFYRCLRDSADCLVNEHGGIALRYGVFDEIAWTDTLPDILYIDHTLFSTPSHQFVPAGSMVCYKLLGAIGMIATGLPATPPARYPYAYWSPGIGMVKQMQSYATNGWMVVHELLRYHVQ